MYRLRTAAETVTLVVTLRAHGCPPQAIVAALGFDKRTVTRWMARGGIQGQAVQAHLVEPPRDLGQVQADEIRVKKQGGMVWMALAMMVKTRLWLAGEVSEQRNMTLIRRLIERVRACALPRPLLFCTDGLCSYIRAMRETFCDSVHTGAQGRPRLRPWRNLCIAQVVKRYAQCRVVDVERRIVDGTPARVETLRRRVHGEGVINTAYIERLNAICRARLAALTRRGRALVRRTLTLQHGMYVTRRNAHLNGERFELSANQYPGAVHPQGCHYLTRFRLEPFPIATYTLANVEIEKSICMIHGEHSTMVHYTASGPCVLEVCALIAFHDYHSTTHHSPQPPGAPDPRAGDRGAVCRVASVTLYP